MFAIYRSGWFKRRRRPALVIAAVATATLLLAACGGGGAESTAGAEGGDRAVIESWARALSAGDVEGAAGYFAIPSTAVNGGLRTEIRSREDAITFNESLPCGVELINARTDGEVTTATFELADRPGGDCGSGAGAEAATTFRIESGEIVEWQRVAVPGGDDAAPAGDDPGTPA